MKIVASIKAKLFCEGSEVMGGGEISTCDCWKRMVL